LLGDTDADRLIGGTDWDALNGGEGAALGDLVDLSQVDANST
jgi:hypothetical protein